jgi:hypothetical protein
MRWQFGLGSLPLPYFPEPPRPRTCSWPQRVVRRRAAGRRHPCVVGITHQRLCTLGPSTGANGEALRDVAIREVLSCICGRNARPRPLPDDCSLHGVRRARMAVFDEETTTDPHYADQRNFYKVEKWSRNGMRVVELLYAGSSLDHAREQSGSNTRSMRAHWLPTVCRWLADHHYNCESHFASPYNLPFGGYCLGVSKDAETARPSCVPRRRQMRRASLLRAITVL